MINSSRDVKLYFVYEQMLTSKLLIVNRNYDESQN